VRAVVASAEGTTGVSAGAGVSVPGAGAGAEEAVGDADTGARAVGDTAPATAAAGDKAVVARGAMAAPGEVGMAVNAGGTPATVGGGGKAIAVPGIGVDTEGVPEAPVAVETDDPAGVSPAATGVVPSGTAPAVAGGAVNDPGVVAVPAGLVEVLPVPVDEPDDDVPAAEPPRVIVNAS